MPSLPWMRRAAAGILAVVATAAVASATVTDAAAATSTDCTTRSVAQKLLSVDGDTNYYFTAPSGTFEAGAGGWQLSNAAVVSGNESRYVNGTSHSRSLQISSGGAATTPRFCNQFGERSIRFFYRGTPGSTIRLHIDVSNSATGNRSTLDWETGVPGSGWGVANGIMVPDLYVQGAENLQLTFTASGGTVQIDDVEIDPFKSL